jgi:hypothetical protein
MTRYVQPGWSLSHGVAWDADPSRCDYPLCMADGTEPYGDRHYCPAHFQQRATATIDRAQEDA